VSHVARHAQQSALVVMADIAHPNVVIVTSTNQKQHEQAVSTKERSYWNQKLPGVIAWIAVTKCQYAQRAHLTGTTETHTPKASNCLIRLLEQQCTNCWKKWQSVT
jgi:hypothetical protein